MELIVANLTPFTPGGALDEVTLAAHARWLVEAGVDALAPAGTTGEFLYLSTAERRAAHRVVLSAALDAAADARVIPCVWDALPGRAAELARAAEAEGAAAVFLPPPLYHAVSEDDVLRWYAAVRDAVDIPVWAYHHPRTHNPLTPALLGRLFDEVGLEAVKDSSGDPERVRALAAAWPGRVRVGGDKLLGRLSELGPVAGHVSGMANLYPALGVAVARGGDDSEWLRRVAVLKAGGGSSVPAMKRALGFGRRPPIIDGAPGPGLPATGFSEAPPSRDGGA